MKRCGICHSMVDIPTKYAGRSGRKFICPECEYITLLEQLRKDNEEISDENPE